MLDKKLFAEIVSATGDGSLHIFSRAWKNQTPFNLKQLAGTLYPSERRRAGGAFVIIIGLLGLAIFVGLWLTLPQYLPSMPGDMGPVLGGFFAAALTSLTLMLLLITIFWKPFENYWLSHGIARTYTTDLKRFAEAIAVALDVFPDTLDGLAHMNKVEACLAADAALSLIARKLTAAEEARDTAEPEDFAEKNAIIANLQQDLARTYDALASLGLAEGGYARYFRYSRRQHINKI